MKLPQPTKWEYRWILPGTQPGDQDRVGSWRELTESRGSNIAAEAAKLLAFRHNKRQMYECRRLYSEEQVIEILNEQRELLLNK